MESWYPVVIGTVAFAYIHLFNWNARKHLTGQKEDSSL
jgi:hypothetical protein